MGIMGIMGTMGVMGVMVLGPIPVWDRLDFWAGGGKIFCFEQV
jgi:hypothetical protein